LEDGVYSASAKNSSSKDVKKVLSFLYDGGYKLQKLGRPLSITEDIEHLSSCDFFIGVDSGISHICHSVGTPCIVIQNKMSLGVIEKAHKNKKYILAKNIIDFIDNYQNYMTQIGEWI